MKPILDYHLAVGIYPKPSKISIDMVTEIPLVTADWPCKNMHESQCMTLTLFVLQMMALVLGTLFEKTT